MTVHRIRRAQPPADRMTPVRVRAELAVRLLAVTPELLGNAALRRDACGSRRRLQALIAIGHPGASLARYLGVPSPVVWSLIRGTTTTVSANLENSVRSLYDRIWDLRPAECTAAECRAAAAARTRAAQRGWPTPMGPDDDRIDDPDYRPRSRWQPASGVGVTDAHAGQAAAPAPGPPARRSLARARCPAHAGSRGGSWSTQ